MSPAPALAPDRFAYAGGETGILLLHGFTGAPPEVRPMGEYLAGKGMTVVAPLLPGHGTTPADLNRRSWRELAQAARAELTALQGRCERVFVGGLSMGGLLTLHLGQSCRGIAGLIPMAAAVYVKDPLHRLLPLAKHLVATVPKPRDIHASVEDESCEALLWSYDVNPVRFANELMHLMREVRSKLPELDLPMLIFQGEKDRSVPVKAARAIAERCRSQDVELVLLARSGHCLSVDQEREQVFARTWQWIERHSKG